MKIVNTNCEYSIDKLHIGDTFEYDGNFYMMIPFISTYNAIRLSDGSLMYFADERLVKKVDCELHIL